VNAPFDSELSEHIWNNKYRYIDRASDLAERSIEQTWNRVASAVASVESSDRPAWGNRFAGLLDAFRFLPAGRILHGAGTRYRTTLFNCFVMGSIEDSVQGIFDRLKEAAVTMQWGGGIGCDFSTLRPRGAIAGTRGAIASGPVSFMRMWDSMCATLLSTGARRGAMMATLRCDHPDVEEFIDAKREAGELTNFNLSVQVTDEFMRAVALDSEWPLVFPTADQINVDSKLVRWPGYNSEVPCKIHRRVTARDLWRRIVDATYDTAEPGLLFVDRINRLNNLHYREHITATNPCGEIPLPPFGACNLGSINLTQFVDAPFSSRARLNLRDVADVSRLAVRFLDNVNDLSQFPLDEQAREAHGSRRLGLGITGLGDALIMLGLDYASDAGRELAQTTLRVIRDEAYRSSIELSREKGSFAFFDKEAYLDGEYLRELPGDIRDGIARQGIRNSHLLAIAPAGTISVLANNVSSGIEPIFALESDRRVLNREGQFNRHPAVDYAFSEWRRLASSDASLPKSFVTAHELSAEAHLQMQAVLQPLVDNSISKTINVPEDISKADFGSIYKRAYELELKGCTLFRPNPITGSILSVSQGTGRIHCCTPDREGD